MKNPYSSLIFPLFVILSSINPKRLVLTHMGGDMLSRLSDVPHEAAEDGKIIEI